MQRVPGHRTGDGERPTAERAATMSWYDEMMAAGRSAAIRFEQHTMQKWSTMSNRTCMLVWDVVN